MTNRCYVHELKQKSHWVNCAGLAQIGFCPLSLANDPTGLREKNGKTVKAYFETKYVYENRHARVGIK